MTTSDHRTPIEQQLRDMNEALVVSSVHQHELTEQAEKAVAALRASEERFRTLFELGPAAVYACDATGVIVEYNRRAAELWGRKPAPGDTDERFCGSFQLLRPDGSFMAHHECPMAEVVSGAIPEVHDGEVLINRPDGSRITVVVNIRPLKNSRGEITGAINCFYDITERSRLEQQTREQAEALADLHRRKDEFLAMLSHELRNPLAPITNALHLLRLQKSEDQLQHQARTVIERQVGQLTRLIDDLLEVSRISTGRIQLHLGRVAYSVIVENSIETVRPLINQRHHTLKVSLPPQPIWLNVDAARMEQVVVNLLTNAAKYTVDGGYIDLSVEREGDEAVLRVRDSGVGIASDLLPRIFELFTQAERSLDRSEGGLGIGLSLVQRLVELQRGRIEVYSVLGQGSEFVVRLPVMVAPATQPPAPCPEPAAPTGSALRVLVVDDNVDAAQTVAMLIKASGHAVRMAHDGPTALDAALDYRPNVVLLDIGLPGLDGFEVAKKLRQESELGSIVLIAVTGYGQEADRQRAWDAGFDHHLVKPADFAKVREILASVTQAGH